jgi:hypothetical protein
VSGNVSFQILKPIAPSSLKLEHKIAPNTFLAASCLCKKLPVLPRLERNFVFELAHSSASATTLTPLHNTIPEHRISRIGEHPRLRDVIAILVSIPTSRYWLLGKIEDITSFFQRHFKFSNEDANTLKGALKRHSVGASTFIEDYSSPRNPDLPPALPIQGELEGNTVFPPLPSQPMEMEGSETQHSYELDGGVHCGCEVYQVLNYAELCGTEVNDGLENYMTLSCHELSADPTRADQLQAGQAVGLGCHTSQSSQAHLSPQMQYSAFSTGTAQTPSHDSARQTDSSSDRETPFLSNSQAAGRSVSSSDHNGAPNDFLPLPDHVQEQTHYFLVTVESFPTRTMPEKLRGPSSAALSATGLAPPTTQRSLRRQSANGALREHFCKDADSY